GPAWYHPGRSGTIKMGPKVVLGYFGEFHPLTLEALDVSGACGGLDDGPGFHRLVDEEGEVAPHHLEGRQLESRLGARRL
ncbi:hypothetical protein AB9F35_36125, partial [Rhizobium leguminosarum]|uniref:hypothetical protein n=1 Tax=Rhizobium leguminosarum TaxID=384 RepID=UPI003F9A207A